MFENRVWRKRGAKEENVNVGLESIKDNMGGGREIAKG